MTFLNGRTTFSFKAPSCRQGSPASRLQGCSRPFPPWNLGSGNPCPLDLTRLTWYGPAKGIMDRWAEQFVRIANRKPGEAVTDPTAFTLRPL
ncbi:MAG: hypothetical protein AB1648_05150 [Pseudomonadota bacterium]